jgi:cytochrome bd ubiquinol oxidase subunit I
VPAGAIAVSLALFVVVYGFLGGAFLHFVDRILKKGPDEDELPPHVPEAMRGARPALVIEGTEER